jgi:hypothetical protein
MMAYLTVGLRPLGCGNINSVHARTIAHTGTASETTYVLASSLT